MTAGGDHGHELEGEFPFYSKPVQRQRWGDEQVRPHTNWGKKMITSLDRGILSSKIYKKPHHTYLSISHNKGDTFFDLFYVSA
jgi:hypothetical protein